MVSLDRNSNHYGVFNSAVKGIILALILIVVLTSIAAVLTFFTSLQENYLSVMSLVILLVSAFCGGSKAAACAGGKGLLMGCAVGIGLFLLLFLVSITLSAGEISLWGSIPKLGYTLLAAVLGGFAAVAKM